MSDTVTPNQKPARRPWKRWVLLGCVLVVCASLFGLVKLMQTRPVDAGRWVTDQVIARVNAVLPQGRIAFRSIKVGLGPNYRPQLYLDDILLSDGRGAPLAGIGRLQGDIAFPPLLQGQVDLKRIDANGLILRVDRKMDGQFDFGFGDGAVGQAASFVDILEGVDAFFERSEVAALEEVVVQSVTVNYSDALSGQVWTGDGGDVRLVQDQESLLMTASVAVLTGRQDLATVSMSFERDRDTGEATLSAVLEDAVASDIASQAPSLTWLSVVDAALSGDVQVDVTPEGLGRLSASIELSEGALAPTAEARPIKFSEARMDLNFDPGTQRLQFDEVVVDSAWGRAVAAGTATFSEYDGPTPSVILGQFQVSEFLANPNNLYDAPRNVDAGALDFRLRLNPFTLDIGQGVVRDGDSTAVVTGQISARRDGWNVSLDTVLDEIVPARVMWFWPDSFRPGMRKWFANNILDGTVFDVTAAIRSKPNAKPVVSVTSKFRDGELTPLRTFVPIKQANGALTVANDTLVILIDQAQTTAPQGGVLDLGGSVFSVKNMSARPGTGVLDLQASGTITAVLSVLDQEPFNFISKANQPVTLADGSAVVNGRAEFPMKDRIRGDDVTFDFASTMTNVRTGVLVENRQISAPQLTARVRNGEIQIGGKGTFDGIPFDGAWVQPLGQGPVGSQLEGQVEISNAALDALNIQLPPGTIRGQGPAQLSLALPPGVAPQYRLTSQLNGVGIRIPAIGYSKATNSTGGLTVAGQLGRSPTVETLELSAPGLSASGRLELGQGGSFQAARLERVRVGNWLDAPIVLTNRGANRAPSVTVRSGQLDMRNATFGDASGGDGGAGGPPIDVALDRLTISEGIVLTDFQGALETAQGLTGSFRAQVNGGARIQGTLTPGSNGSIIRINSSDGGAVIRDAGLMKQVRGGDFALILSPTGTPGTFDGVLDLRNIRVTDAPAMAALLNSISVVGLLQQLDGQGLAFSNVDANFRLTPKQVIVRSSSATGPSLGISLDGIFTLGSNLMDFQGVVSPVYLLNGIGSILTRRGEGLIGFNFTLQGQTGAPQVGVNPLSVLTPGMFREIFRRPPPKVSQ